MTTTTLCVRRLLPLLLRLLQPQGRRAAAIGPRAVRWFCPSAPSSCVAEQLARAACSLLAIAHLSDAARLHLLPQAIVVAALLVLFACIPTIGPNTHPSRSLIPRVAAQWCRARPAQRNAHAAAAQGKEQVSNHAWKRGAGGGRLHAKVPTKYETQRVSIQPVARCSYALPRRICRRREAREEIRRGHEKHADPPTLARCVRCRIASSLH